MYKNGYQKFNKYLLKVRSFLLFMDNLKNNQSKLFEDMVYSIKNGKPFNLQGLLEIVNTTTDVDAQVKLFSILSAYLMLNNTNIDAIVTYNPLYDKICNILAKYSPRKATVAFNFLSALLYIDEEDSHRKTSLVAYARNMIRSSGCLAIMCDLFTSSMMHQDAWRALCRCLSESCRGIEANQSYCTHLVPTCVQRFSLRNVEVLLVLQSLLQNHSRNINLFVECNGISLFQREFLHHHDCLQLLATIVQSSKKAVEVIAKKNICQQLQDFLRLYGPQSQLGQWATIILYHTSRVEATCDSPNENNGKEINKPNESLLAQMKPVCRNRESECSADTTKFFQNVMKEVIQCGGQKEFRNLQAVFPSNIMMNRSPRNTVNYDTRVSLHEVRHRNKVCMSTRDVNESKYLKLVVPNLIRNESMQLNKTNELSFSFLRKQHLNNKHVTTMYSVTDKIPESLQRTLQTNESNVGQNTVYEFLTENNESRLNTLGTNDFKPIFASTPKKGRINNYSMYENQHLNNNTGRSVKKSIKNHQIKRRMEKKRVPKRLELNKIDKEIKHRSISGRFFDAINTSCTTLVKTVKNIFKPKSDLHQTKKDCSSEMSNVGDTLSCSYSFTNYMRKRDAILINKNTNKSVAGLVTVKSKEGFEDFSLEMTNSCNTCNDTIALKRKLATDDHLKQTIRKLKLGINLYGCDFKKISRTMWSNESYMTAAVLYNLYRKLIVK